MLTTIETIVSITTRRNKIGMHFFSVNKSIIFLSDEFHQFRFIVTISLTEFETFINLSSQKKHFRHLFNKNIDMLSKFCYSYEVDKILQTLTSIENANLKSKQNKRRFTISYSRSSTFYFRTT